MLINIVYKCFYKKTVRKDRKNSLSCLIKKFNILEYNINY